LFLSASGKIFQKMLHRENFRFRPISGRRNFRQNRCWKSAIWEQFTSKTAN